MQKNEFSIAVVSRDAGIAKEVLRKWESRYGFPVPHRDALGNRLYLEEQLDRLIIVKKLIDDGMRPAQVVALEHVTLLALLQNREQAEKNVESPPFPAVEV